LDDVSISQIGKFHENSAADAYRSIALVWGSGSDVVTAYVNAAVARANSNTRNLTVGPVSVGAAIGGTMICNPSNAMVNANVNHPMCFAGALTLAQVKALHNLFAHQYGLATVA
jgi:hypothetical protein